MRSDHTRKAVVLHLIGTLRIGGAEQQLASIAPLFDPDKFRIIVCTMAPGGVLENRLHDTPVEMRTLNFRLRTAPVGVWRLYRLLKQEKVDILHMHMYGAALYGRMAGLLARVPIMITTDHGKGLWKKPWHVAVERIFNRFTALRIVVSRDIEEILKSREKIPQEKLLFLPNGVDTERFQVGEAERKSVRTELNLPDEAVVVGVLARLVPPKALHILIEAIAKLAQTNPQVRLMIVGDGPLRADLKRCSVDLRADNFVSFTGERSDVPAVLAAMDIFALSSIREGLPISLLEAMAAGKPIVATKVGGIPETVRNRQEALLVEPNNPGALAEALEELIDKPELAADLGKQAKERAKARYSAEATVLNLEEIYSSLLARKRSLDIQYRIESNSENES